MVAMKMMAKMIVILSRFFSTIDVPVMLLLRDAARISLTPVPLPECSMIMTTKPTPETSQRITRTISSALKICS